MPRDYRDIAAGSALLLLGLFVAVYCATHYQIGSLSQLGPGLFPCALGCLLAVFGTMVLVPALWREGERVTFEVRPALAVLASLIAFALSIERAGLVPAIVLLTVIASLADNKLGVARSLILAAAISIIGAIIFHFGLGLPVDLARLPF